MVNVDSFALVDGLGVLGFLTYATAELLLAFRKIHSEQIFFYLIYALGAGLILTSLLWEFNMGAFLSEAFSLMICFLAIFVRLRVRSRARGGPETDAQPAVDNTGAMTVVARLPRSNGRPLAAPVLQAQTR